MVPTASLQQPVHAPEASDDEKDSHEHQGRNDRDSERLVDRQPAMQPLEHVTHDPQYIIRDGDDRQTLLQAFRAAGERADAVIVNGGLGPTVDDLSQEIAAQAAGVELVLHEGWLARMEERFRQRGRIMAARSSAGGSR